jgi:hypothetical protein
MNLFGPISMLSLLIEIALLCLILFALVDALIRPSAAYVAASKRTKLLWGLVLAVGFGVAFLLGFTGSGAMFSLLGVVAAIVYLVDVRPAVKSVGRGGSAQGPYGSW